MTFERDWIIERLRQRVAEADEAIREAPDLRDGGKYRASLEGRWRGLHELLRDLDPSEPAQPFSTRTMQELNEIAEREGGSAPYRLHLHLDG